VASGSGCQQEASFDDATIVMSVGQHEIRLDEFNRAYRMYRSAYGEGVDKDPAVERESKLRFIQQLADQMVLMAHAHDIGVDISDDALNRAVDNIREDYPDDLFDQMLLENAINFEQWKEALRVRLVIDQLVRQELSQNIQITEGDIADYYQNNAADSLAPDIAAPEKAGDHSDQRLVQQLRRQKTEQAYTPWLAGLRAQYPVDIDQAVIARIISNSKAPLPGGDHAGSAE
jgi:hypothetical protein